MEHAGNASVNPTTTPGIPDIPLGLPSASSGHAAFRYAFAGASFAVNATVIVVISCSRQLHLPRHVFWAGISLVILFCTAQWVVELHIGHAPSDLCAVYELSIGVWYPALLLFLSLAGLDRYLAIRHYNWYRRKMSNRKAILSMAVTFVLNAVVVDLPYWTNLKSLDRCAANATHVGLIFAWNMLLGVVNMILQARIFSESRRAIRMYRFNGYYNAQVFVASFQLARRYGARGTDRMDDVTVGSGRLPTIECLPMGRASSGVDRLDFRAALILSANVLPFWLCTLPVACYAMAYYWCGRFRVECSPDALAAADVFVKVLFFVPCVYMPLVFMWSSGEFSRALRHLFAKVEPAAVSSVRQRHRMD